MFGFVVADSTMLSESQLKRYRSYYCGLCRCIGAQYGTVRRLALSNDLTFLIMLLSSLYESDETQVSGRCLLHPFRKENYLSVDCTEYAAAMNVALAYHKCRDDWSDDQKVSAHLLSAAYRSGAKKAAGLYPRQYAAIEQGMRNLSELEAKQIFDPDQSANSFGALMEELFIWKEDRWEPLLRKLGNALGRFIYLMDAVLDYSDDIQNGKYNPLRGVSFEDDPKVHFMPILQMTIGECTEAFEALPLLRDVDLMRNILYSGVWAHLFRKNREEQHD